MPKVLNDLPHRRQSRPRSLNDFMDVDYADMEVRTLASSVIPSSEARFISTGRLSRAIPMYTLTRDGRFVHVEVELDRL